MNTDFTIKSLSKEQIDGALEKEYRQYLAGRLTRVQKYLPHIDDDIEVGISYYKDFTADKPHKHPIATEHGYVLEGLVRIKLIEGEKKEYEFKSGDFFVIEKNVPYVTKNAAGTKILFIKSPGINDKTVIEVDYEILDWLSRWDI